MGRTIRTTVRVFCFLGVSLFTSTSLAAPLNGHVILAGSSTIQPVAGAFGLAFEKQHIDVRIDVHGGGSSVGITAPQTGLADIGMVSRPLRHNETRASQGQTFFHGLEKVDLEHILQHGRGISSIVALKLHRFLSFL